MKALKNIVVLTLITVLAGFLLGYVYDLTKDPIAAAKEKVKTDACRTVFNDAVSFNELNEFDSELATLDVKRLGYSDISIDETLIAVDASGGNLGYVITVTSSEGYGGDITLLVGIRTDGTINGIEFLSISETAGLGMKADTVEFKRQFSGMRVSQINYTKTKKQNDYEIEAISGATITTNAVTDAVNASLGYFNAVSGGTDNE